MADSVEKEIRELCSLFWSERDPEGRAFAPLADAYRRQGDLDQALELLEDGLGRHQDFTPGHVVAGWVLRDRGETQAAAEAFDAALSLDDENLEALRGLGDLAAERGDAATAAGCYRKLVELEPTDPEVRARLIEAERAAHTAAERPDPAVPVADSADLVVPADAIHLGDDVVTAEEAVFTVEDVVLDVGGVGEAVELDVCIEPEPESEPMELPRGEPEPAAVDPAELPVLEAASPPPPPAPVLELVPPANAGGQEQDGPVTRTMADLYARQGLHERALRVCRRLLERTPDDAGLAERVRAMEALVPSPPPDVPVAEPEEPPVPARAEAVRAALRSAAAPPPLRPSDAEVEALARDWAEGPRQTGDLSTPFAWTPPAEQPGRPAPTGASRPVREYFQALLGWEPGAAPAAQPVVLIASLVPDSTARIVPIASLAPDPVEETPRAAAPSPAGAAGNWAEPAPTADSALPVDSGPAMVVPIESLAPAVVDVATLAPDEPSDTPAAGTGQDDFGSWLERLR